MRRVKFFVLAALLAPGLALGANPTVQSTKAALAAARADKAAHDEAAEAARAQARRDAARAALLAEQQVAAALRLRGLEVQTGIAADQFTALQARETAAREALRQNEAALTQLLPIMQRLATAPDATMLATPETPANAIRGILVLQGIAADIETRAAAVKAQALDVNTLIAQSSAEQAVLNADTAAQQTAEDALTRQIAAARAAELADLDVVAAQAAASAEADTNILDLRGMLGQLQAAPPPGAAPQAPAGSLPAAGIAPVAGDISENYGDPTVAGPAEGVTYHAVAGARVTAPCAGPVLFANRFQSYGLLVILDCGGGYDFVLSGMSRLDVSAGQRLARGQPIGQMRGLRRQDSARPGDLYVELRRGGVPVNPDLWLVAGGSG